MVDPVGFHPIGRSRPVRDQAASQASRTASPAEPELRLSPSLPKLVGLARQLAQAGPPVDYAKIAQVRQAISQGSYEIDADAIAGAMLAFGRKPSA